VLDNQSKLIITDMSVTWKGGVVAMIVSCQRSHHLMKGLVQFSEIVLENWSVRGA